MGQSGMKCGVCNHGKLLKVGTKDGKTIRFCNRCGHRQEKIEVSSRPMAPKGSPWVRCGLPTVCTHYYYSGKKKGRCMSPDSHIYGRPVTLGQYRRCACRATKVGQGKAKSEMEGGVA